MNERQLQFRVGLLVVTAGIVAAGLVFRFGEMRWLWEKHYHVWVHFDRAPGVERGTPVRKNGILIGSVRAVSFDEARGGVNLYVEIREKFPLRKDSRPMLTRSLLGDATLEFAPGTSRDVLRPGDHIEGGPSEDPLEIIARVEAKTTTALDSFSATSEEWRKVGKNLNDLASTQRGNLDQVIEQAAESLHQFTVTMRTVNQTVADPEAQENLRTTLAALPKMMEETRQTVQSIRLAVIKADAALGNLSEVTEPLARRSNSIATRLDKTIAHLEVVMAEMAVFARTVNGENGSLGMLARDPMVYRNLEQTTAAMALMMKNLGPLMEDLRIFSDKIARHPELLGIQGVIEPSSGIKHADEVERRPKMR
jgi:phospholipid/cholesterol/gamma-HCH transport system substrate-binding protein